jgi:gamma-glutamylcyclotransferase (GGCT)/AIG2-like uncharacterized protein YtfP
LKDCSCETPDDFFEGDAPLLEKLLVYPELVAHDERRRLEVIDAALRRDAAIARDGGGAALGKRAELLRGAGYAVLRRYLEAKSIAAEFDGAAFDGAEFDALRSALGFAREPVLLVAYGTLMTGQPNRVPAATRRSLRSRGPCEIRGRLYLVEDGPFGYPGLIRPAGAGRKEAPDAGWVAGELFEIGADDRAAAAVLRGLDAYEEFDPRDPGGSAYLRRFVPVSVGGVPAGAHAWLYLYNGDVARLRPIEGGDWRSFAPRLG